VKLLAFDRLLSDPALTGLIADRTAGLAGGLAAASALAAARSLIHLIQAGFTDSDNLTHENTPLVACGYPQ
jgi:hypothetical protein